MLQPAIKLMDFFRSIAESAQQSAHEEAGGLAVFSTEKSQKLSETMAQLPELALTDASTWIKYWKNAGVLF